jgi:hypothetical protein
MSDNRQGADRDYEGREKKDKKTSVEKLEVRRRNCHSSRGCKKSNQATH